MRRIKRKQYKFLFALLALFLLVVAVIGGRGFSSAFAETSAYSDVLEDLQKDSTFNVDDYPDNADDYSIQLIQIAEGVKGELFIYTYQPCQKTMYLVATEINMALSESVDGTKLYKLNLCNINGVFGKYVVKDFTVSEDEVRYYNITSIYREFLIGVDKNPGVGYDLNYVAFSVGKLFRAITENGSIKYDWDGVQVVQVNNPFFDFLRYTDGFLWHKTACDSHYVAFSTDIKIDYLYEAELEYVSNSILKVTPKGASWGIPEIGEPEFHHIVLTDDEEFHKDGKWWLKGESADYSRIQSVKEFIANEDINDTTKKSLSGLQWVLRFAETDYSYQKYTSGVTEKYTSVSEVAVLRLKFNSGGKIYNLGAVADIGSEDRVPGNQKDPFNFWRYIWNCIVKLFKGTANAWETFVAVATLFAGLFVLVLLLKLLSLVVPFLRPVWDKLWWFITLPFQLIASLIHKIRGE